MKEILYSEDMDSERDEKTYDVIANYTNFKVVKLQLMNPISISS